MAVLEALDTVRVRGRSHTHNELVVRQVEVLFLAVRSNGGNLDKLLAEIHVLCRCLRALQQVRYLLQR